VGKFCIVGAGSSGLAVAKNFLERGIAFDCLEREDDVGGNWYYGKPNSSVYQSTRLISSKRLTEYTDFPMPADWPEQPAHDRVWQYLRSYAQHFDLYPHIEFQTSIERIERPREYGSAASCWDVVLSTGERRRYRGVVIANGHNWDPRWPAYAGEFHGGVLHSSQYKAPDVCRGRRVLVVGGGNSGFDIAVDAATQAAAVFHSLRRSYAILPRFYRGRPIDQLGEWMLRWRLPLWLRRMSGLPGYSPAWPADVAEKLPTPDHRLFETHPVINSRWPYDVARGRVRMKPDIEALQGDAIRFRDGSLESIDLVIYATGYRISFPFIDATELNWRDGRPDLYLNIFHPGCDDLFIAGLIQPDSGQFGLVDCQSQLIAEYIVGLRQESRSARRFQAEKRAPWDASGGIRYLDTPRHLLEVEHFSYRRKLQKAIRRLRR
jgi:cation diffusion facilitator CzcD-associated flavoprotein CzcO